MKSFIQYIKEGKASKAASLVSKALKGKVMGVLEEERKRVASKTFSTLDEDVTTKPVNPSKDLQGITRNHDTEHTNHPFHSTLEKHGFHYDYSGSGGEHHYKHSNPNHPVTNVMVNKNPYQNNKPMYSATNGRSHGGATKQGHEPEKLAAHLSKMAAKGKK
jgi:hypothetical protein